MRLLFRLAIVLIGMDLAPLFAAQAAPSFSIDNATCPEDAGFCDVTIRKHGRLNSQSSSISFYTADGTAKAGSDYAAQRLTVAWTASETRKTVRLATLNDAIPEPPETLTARITGVTNARLYDGTAIVTITDADVEPAPAPDPTPTPEPSPPPSGTWELAPLTHGKYARCKRIGGCRGWTHTGGQFDDYPAKQGEVYLFSNEIWGHSADGRDMHGFYPIGQWGVAYQGFYSSLVDWEGVRPTSVPLAGPVTSERRLQLSAQSADMPEQRMTATMNCISLADGGVSGFASVGKGEAYSVSPLAWADPAKTLPGAEQMVQAEPVGKPYLGTAIVPISCFQAAH